MTQVSKNKTRPRLQVRIREARLEDVKALHPTINLAFRSEGGWTSEHHLVSSERISILELECLIKEGKDPILVATLSRDDFLSALRCSSSDINTDSQSEHYDCNNAADEIVVGCISAEASHMHPQLELPQKSALVGLFSVQPRLQSFGIGGQLFSAILKHIKLKWECDMAILWVISCREDLQKWYEKLGFVWEGEYRPFVLPQFAKQPLDDLRFKIYSRSLTDI